MLHQKVILVFCWRLAFSCLLPSYPLKPSSRKSDIGWIRAHYTSITAGILAYTAYICADFLAHAAFPEFLRDHLFDGLAPAALVGILVNRYPPDGDRLSVFPGGRRPVVVLLLMSIGGLVIFGLIAASAVFSSGSNTYITPIIVVSLLGVYLFGFNYWTDVLKGKTVARRSKQMRPPRSLKGEEQTVAWWFKKRDR